MIVFGFAPLVYLGLREVGGWDGLRARVPETFAHSWTNLGSPADNPMGVEWFGLVMGLGFVLSFGYWCTDFLVVQRAMAADSMNAARRTPVIAALPKMIFPFLVIVPGIIALGLTLQPIAGTPPVLPVTAAGTYDYNMALPMMMARYYPEGTTCGGALCGAPSGRRCCGSRPAFASPARVEPGALQNLP